MIDKRDLLGWLQEKDPSRLDHLWKMADEMRHAAVGAEVHIRGLIEISNNCVRACSYCGLRAARAELQRYRMKDEDIVRCAVKAESLGYGTVVLQSGEDPAFDSGRVAGLVLAIKSRTKLAVTLSLGERTAEELRLWREAGADRYLLRFETSDEKLYQLIHPPLPGRDSDRLGLLKTLRVLGYEVGSGVMVGIPGQTYGNLLADLLLFRDLDLDMIGIGPYLAHPATPLGAGQKPRVVPPEEQVPATVDMACRVVALARLLCPKANIPSTTALATLDKKGGRELGLRRGANVVMPNLTPQAYRSLYEIYPSKSAAGDLSETLPALLKSIGRIPGKGPGGRRK